MAPLPPRGTEKLTSLIRLQGNHLRKKAGYTEPYPTTARKTELLEVTLSASQDGTGYRGSARATKRHAALPSATLGLSLVTIHSPGCSRDCPQHMSDSALALENAELLDGVSSSSRKKSRPLAVPPKKRQPPRQPHRFLQRLLCRAASGHRNHSLAEPGTGSHGARSAEGKAERVGRGLEQGTWRYFKIIRHNV